MICKLMVTASLVAMTACGAEMSDDGSGPGSGSACNSGSECSETEACDLVAHVCVADVLTVDPSDFVVQSSIWWTKSMEPTLRGTFKGSSSSMIEARIGTQSTPASKQGSMWSAKLAASSITTSNTKVTISMSDGKGVLVEAVRSLGLDGAPPAITLAPSPVRDERGDAIDFGSGEPAHTHSGAAVDLAASGCPSVYKYAYLMSAVNPAFGRQTARNPLAWNLAIAAKEIDPASTAYRVRNPENQVVLDWTAVRPTASNNYAIELFRDGEHGIAALGTTAGQFTLDVRARDVAGLETVSSYCWDHHPLAAPLEISQLDKATAVDPNGLYNGLFGMSLAANSPISVLAGFGTGAAVASQRIVQYTAEPIVVSATQVGGGAHVSRTYVDDYVAVTDLGSIACAGFDCDATMPADPADSTISAATSGQSWTLAIVDEQTGQLINGAVIPPRTTNEPPHAYRVFVSIAQVSELCPAQFMYPGEFSIGGLGYTGFAATGLFTKCAGATTEVCHGQFCQTYCPAKQFGRMVALDTVSLDFNAMSVDFKVSPSSSVAPAAPSHVSASTFSMAATTWNGGDDDLPGPK